MPDERVSRLAQQLLTDGYLDTEAAARIAARRILWAVDGLPGDPPQRVIEALPS